MPFGGPTRKGAGGRRQRIQLQSPTTIVDSLKGRSITWTTYASASASVEPQPFVVSEQQATMLYLVTMPYRSTTAIGHRVLASGGLRLKVLEVNDPELRHRDTILHCARD